MFSTWASCCLLARSRFLIVTGFDYKFDLLLRNSLVIGKKLLLPSSRSKLGVKLGSK